VFSVTVFTALLGSGFQRRTFSQFPNCALLSYQLLTSLNCNSQLTDCFQTDWLSNRSLLTLTHRVTLRLAIYRQLVRLGAKPIEAHGQTFFLKLNPCSHSPYATFSPPRGWGCLLWIGFVFVKCTYRTYNMLLKNLSCALYTIPLLVQALQSRPRLLAYLML
jgi:hypothetical protein